MFFFLLLFSSNNLYADPCDPIDPLCDETDPDAPIDSGVGLLIGAAAFYTVKKLREKKTDNDDNAELRSPDSSLI